jgi:hypothetical protein
MYCHTFSTGLSSGHLGGSVMMVTLAGTTRRVDIGSLRVRVHGDRLLNSRLNMWFTAAARLLNQCGRTSDGTCTEIASRPKEPVRVKEAGQETRPLSRRTAQRDLPRNDIR